jgi:hypothetical protein
MAPSLASAPELQKKVFCKVARGDLGQLLGQGADRLARK